MAEQMLAAVYYGPHDLRVEQRPIPQVGPDEALLKVVSTGICGTDLRIWRGEHRKYPPGTVRVPGHEVAGDLVGVGSGVAGLSVGQRVFVAPNLGCGRCRQCVAGNNNLCPDFAAPGITFDGSFAEYMHIPSAAIQQGNVIPIPSQVDPAAAALIEPFACVLRGQQAVHSGPGDAVLVIGAGPIGSMHALLARLRGACPVIVSEINPQRLAQAAELGADRLVNPAQEDLLAVVRAETGGAGADVVIVAAPSPSAQQAALQLAAVGGRINYFGGLPKDQPAISFDSNLVHYKELLVTGTTACSTADCWRAAAIAGAGRIDLARLVGARYPLAEALAAFQTAQSGLALKVVLEPPAAG
jgi:L-iditol 2-dehydrogenase